MQQPGYTLTTVRPPAHTAVESQPIPADKDQDSPRDRKQPFMGNQIRFTLRTLKRARKGEIGLLSGPREPLFGTRLRWARSVLRDAATKRHSRSH